MFSLAQWPLIQVLLLVSDTCWSAGIASEETFWGGKGWGHKVFLKSHSDLFFIERLSHCISKRFCAPSLLNHCFFMSESSRSMKSQCNITSKAVAPRVKWRSRFKRAPSGLGENAFQHRWKFTIYIIFYVPNASLAQNSSSSGQRKPCKYYVKNAEKGLFLIDILTDRSILRWLRMNFKAFPPELRANLSGNHGRNRECSFSQIRNLLKTNTSRISGLPKKWQTGGRDKCLSAAEPSEFLKVWLIRIPSFCVDDSNSVPILPLPIIFFCTIGPGSSIHKLYDLRSPNSQPSELGNLTRCYSTIVLKYYSTIVL